MSNAAYFQEIYQEADPFGYRSRWYEERKRALTLACLPRRRYANAWELGCSNGVLTAALAKRCDALLGTDICDGALAQAALSTRACAHVVLRRATHPGDWPDGVFDLIVVSEVGYYLEAGELALLGQKLRSSLADGGLLLACHWNHPFDEARSSACEVHRELQAELPGVFSYRDDDFLLEGWSTSTTSVAEREGLR